MDCANAALPRSRQASSSSRHCASVSCAALLPPSSVTSTSSASLASAAAVTLRSAAAVIHACPELLLAAGDASGGAVSRSALLAAAAARRCQRAARLCPRCKSAAGHCLRCCGAANDGLPDCNARAAGEGAARAAEQAAAGPDTRGGCGCAETAVLGSMALGRQAWSVHRHDEGVPRLMARPAVVARQDERAAASTLQQEQACRGAGQLPQPPITCWR